MSQVEIHAPVEFDTLLLPGMDTVELETPSPEKENSSSPVSCVTKQKSTNSKVNGHRRKKPRLDHDATVSCAKDIVPSLAAADEDITEEEIKLLNADHWYNTDPAVYLLVNATQAHKDSLYKLYHFGMGLIREAYLSVKKKTRGTRIDITKVLRDDFSMTVLFKFASCIRRLQDYTKRTSSIHTNLSDTIKSNSDQAHTTAAAAASNLSAHRLESSAGCKDQDKSEECKCIPCTLADMEKTVDIRHTEILNSVEKFLLAVEERAVKYIGKPKGKGHKKFSTKIYHILLILKEILTQMGFCPEESQVSQGCKGDMEAVKVASKSDAGDLCIKCGNNLKPLVDSTYLKAVHDAASNAEIAENELCKFIDGRLKSFQIQFETEGFVKRYYIDGESAELMRFVEGGMRHLVTDLKKEDLILFDLLNFVRQSFPFDAAPFRRARACNERRKTLMKELKVEILSFIRYLCDTNEKNLYTTFRGIIEVLCEYSDCSI